MKHQDRVAIVTGSAQGIGTAIAQKLSEEGASIVIADINGEGATEVAGSLPNAIAVTVDTSSENIPVASIKVARFAREVLALQPA